MPNEMPILEALVHRRIQRIHLAVHYLFGFASTFANRPDRSVGADALGDVDELTHVTD